MKTRTGFVSNSSSSSYIIALKEPLKDTLYDIETRLMDYLDVNINSPFYPIAEEVVSIFLDNMKDCGDFKSAEDELYNKWIEELEDREDLDEFKHIYIGDISTEDGGIEEFIINYIEMNINEDELYMHFDGMF